MHRAGDAHAHARLHRGKRKKGNREYGRERERERETHCEGTQGGIGWWDTLEREGWGGEELQLEYHASITPKARIGGFSEV